MIGLTLPLVADAYFGPMLERRGRGAVRERHADRPGTDAARARPRGVAARALDARHHRRRDPHAAGGVCRGTADAAAAGIPVRRRRPARAAARGHRLRRRDARLGCEAGDGASAGARPPPDRRDRRCCGLVRHRGAPRRVPRGARRCRGSCSTPTSSCTRTGGSRAARRRRAQLLSLPEPPTAIFGFNDNVAIGALHAARERGLSVPDDLSVVGFDDTEQAVIVTPRLTSVRQPLAELGRMGVSLADPPDRRTTGRRSARRARDAARRPRIDRATAELSSCASRPSRRSSWPGWPPAPRSVSGAARGAHTRSPNLVADRPGRAANRRPRARQRVGDRGEPDRSVVDVERGARLEHALLGQRAQAAADGHRRRRPDRASPTTEARASSFRRGRLRSGAVHLRMRGREAAGVDTDRPDRLVDAQPRSWSTRRPRRRSSAALRSSVTRVYATDFHNGRVDVYDAHWRRVRRAGAFEDPAIPSWYAPFGVQAIGGPPLRDVRLARAGQRQRCADRRLRRRVRPRRSTRRARGSAWAR